MARTLRIVLTLAVLASLSAASSAAAAFEARGSAEQVYATGLEPRAKATLLDPKGKAIAKRRATPEGGVLFREVGPGEGYRVRVAGESSDPLTVFSNRPAPPSTDIYDQKLPSSGYGYLTTRDGTKLAYSVRPPQDVTQPAGGITLPEPTGAPNPTLIEYSGYGYANPAGPNSGIAALANIMGFTVVDVNMRGTGCSGGAFDFFEPLQNLDAYDVIETVARQSWVSHNHVGMLGISYGGISQLFAAQLQPPSLAAITPVSLIDSVQTTLYPGGILNTGFAVAWTEERLREAKPSLSEDQGQKWAYDRIQAGDEVCRENQALHNEQADLIGMIEDNETYKPEVVDPRSPVTFVDKINVPVFMACQWQDEQTGGHCPTLAARMTGTDKKWFTFTNGTHVDSLSPETYNKLYDFLMLYVAKQAPAVNSARVQLSAPLVYDAAMGIDDVTLPPDPIQQEPTYEGALAAFEAQEPIRILFESGAGGDPGYPYPAFEHSFASLPIPGTKGRSWFLARRGRLADKRSKRAGADRFTWNAKARPLTNFTGSTSTGENGLWTATPVYEWEQPPKGSGLAYVSKPLAENTTVIGQGRLDMWVRSSRPRTDLQVTVTEVRPDGKETFVQGGWLRGDLRKLDRKKSTPLEPRLSLRKKHISPLRKDRFVKATVPLYYHAHAYRAGSRIRVIVTAPNGDQPVWSFGKTRPKKKAKVAVAYSKKKRSRLVLPVVPDIEVPTELPPCPSLRAQPCRDYERVVNRRAKG